MAAAAMIVVCVLHVRRRSEMQHEEVERNPRRDAERRLGFADGRLAPVAGGDRVRVGRPWARAAEHIGDRRVHAVQPQSRFTEPPSEVGNRRVAAIVEMAAGGEKLDALEPIARDLGQMTALEPPVVIKVRGNPEAHGQPVRA